MNAKEALTNFEIVALEELVFGDDCECESAHLPIKGIEYPCSVDVIGRKTTQCGRDIPICASSWNLNQSVIQKTFPYRVTCEECGRLASECWTIRPI